MAIKRKITGAVGEPFVGLAPRRPSVSRAHRFPADAYERLEAIAKARGVRFADVLNAVVDAGLAVYEKQKRS
jgi:hypothetical protein